MVKLLPNREADKRIYIHLDFLNLMRLFHRLPSLHSISVDGMDQKMASDFRYEFPLASCGLKKIHIGHSASGSHILGTILRVPKALEEVTLTSGGRSTHDGGSNPMVPMTIGKALLDHKTTLRKLDIDLDAFCTPGIVYMMKPPEQQNSADDDSEEELEDSEDDYMEFECDELWHKDVEISTILDPTQMSIRDLPNTRDYGATIGSLHDFTALTHLSIGVRFLLNGTTYITHRELGQSGHIRAPFRLIEILPPSLEQFTIRGYKKGDNIYHDQQISKFMSLKSEIYPRLLEIRGCAETVLSAKHWHDNNDESSCYQRETVDTTWAQASMN